MINQEQADHFFSDAKEVAEEMRRAFQRGGWNLATCRAHEVLEHIVIGLLCNMNVEYPRTHEGTSVLVEAIRHRDLVSDPGFLDWLSELSQDLGEIRGPAFNHEIEVGESEARAAVNAADRVLAFGQEFLGQLRGKK